ncbi:hypothetical protein MRS44_004813 [Fusarium solani]|uniref:uncharacterized protein n=1 Tax=Fusarium solani TaxID=169388 RepID=UPI0032C43ED7|nr:hypothetical protein MRS44_004813 [Fusarium solani]
MAKFIPRQAFSIPGSVPKTYYIGHHASAEQQVVNKLSNISLILECRDFRLPLSTHNPRLERTVAGRQRLVVYTKSSFGSDTPGAANALRKLHADRCVIWDKTDPATTKALLKKVKEVAREADSLTGLWAMIVGMPNVGKSSLLNALRKAGHQEGAGTGRYSSRLPPLPDQPRGSHHIRAILPSHKRHRGVARGRSRKEGKIKRGGHPVLSHAAARVLFQWREGNLGRFVLDDISDSAIEEYQACMANPKLSLNQAKKLQKQARAQEKAGA